MVSQDWIVSSPPTPTPPFFILSDTPRVFTPPPLLLLSCYLHFLVTLAALLSLSPSSFSLILISLYLRSPLLVSHFVSLSFPLFELNVHSIFVNTIDRVSFFSFPIDLYILKYIPSLLFSFTVFTLPTSLHFLSYTNRLIRFCFCFSVHPLLSLRQHLLSFSHSITSNVHDLTMPRKHAISSIF